MIMKFQILMMERYCRKGADMQLRIVLYACSHFSYPSPVFCHKMGDKIRKGITTILQEYQCWEMSKKKIGNLICKVFNGWII